MLNNRRAPVSAPMIFIAIIYIFIKNVDGFRDPYLSSTTTINNFNWL